MKKTIKAIGITATMGIMLAGAYLLGTMQAEIITEIQTVTETKEVMPDGYIDMDSAVFHDNYIDMRKVVGFSADDNGLQLYLTDGSGYWLERQE